MAKAMCKCFVCGVTFDRNAVQAVRHSANRYSHATCEPENKNFVPMAAPKKAEDPDLSALKDYIKKVYQDKANWVIISKQIKQFAEKGYTYSGMLKTLIYFYEVKHNTIDKSNGGIGIIEYVYNDASKYYYAIWQAQQINLEQMNEAKEITKTYKEYVIEVPKSKGIKNKLIEFEMEDIDFEAEE